MFKKAEDLIKSIEDKKEAISSPNLNNMNELIKLFDLSSKIKYIHVAGTNGKGSVVTFLSNVLFKEGYNIGKFVSPYITNFNERICYNNEPISDCDLLYFGNSIIKKYDVIDELGLDKPSFFEFITLLALIYFSSFKKIDFVILEVGLGGIYDPTNVISPIVSVITNISYDHMQYLGHSIEEIAANKLGILKKNVPLITISDCRINKLILDKASLTSSKVIFVKKEDIKVLKLSLDKTIFSYKNKKYKLKMLGKHQTENASLVIEILDKLIEMKYISLKKFKKSLFNTKWHGRLEVLSNKPLIIIDGAHNLDAVLRLIEFLKAVKKKKLIRLIFAVSKDKEIKKMICEFEKEVEEIIFTKANNSRSADPTKLILFSNHKNKKVEVNTDLILSKITKKDKKINIFCGSLYFVSEIRKKVLKKRVKKVFLSNI